MPVPRGLQSPISLQVASLLAARSSREGRKITVAYVGPPAGRQDRRRLKMTSIFPVMQASLLFPSLMRCIISCIVRLRVHRGTTTDFFQPTCDSVRVHVDPHLLWPPFSPLELGPEGKSMDAQRTGRREPRGPLVTRLTLRCPWHSPGSTRRRSIYGRRWTWTA